MAHFFHPRKPFENTRLPSRGSDFMKVLLNTSTLFEGGSLQLGTSMAREALNDSSDIEWQFATSRAVADELRRFHPDAIGHMEVFDDSPAVNRQARRRLLELEARLQPDCVFTAYGPAYVKFAATLRRGSVGGASDFGYRVMKFLAVAAVFFLSIYRGYWFRRQPGGWTDTPARLP
jgi:hypothetical protein